MKQANLINKTDFDDKMKSLNKKNTSNKTKYVLVENEFKKLQTFDSSLFIIQSYFNNDGVQLPYLIFQPIYKTITTFDGLKDTVSEWESKGLSNQKITCTHVTNVNVFPKLVWMNNTRIRLKFKGSCLKQEHRAPFTPKNGVKLFIVHELDSWPSDLNTDFTLGGFLFGSVKLTKDPDPDKYSYSVYDIGFNTRGYLSLPDGKVGKNVIIFGVDLTSSMQIDSKGKDILILGKGQRKDEIIR